MLKLDKGKLKIYEGSSYRTWFHGAEKNSFIKTDK